MMPKNRYRRNRQQYVITARAKGLRENGVIYGTVRNAMLIVSPASGTFSAGCSVLVRSSDLRRRPGLSVRGDEQRDYPVSSLAVIFSLEADANLTAVTYTMVDPRIDFEGGGI